MRCVMLVVQLHALNAKLNEQLEAVQMKLAIKLHSLSELEKLALQ